MGSGRKPPPVKQGTTNDGGKPFWCRIGMHDWVPVGYETRQEENEVGIVEERSYGFERCRCGARKSVDITHPRPRMGNPRGYQPRYPMADRNGKPYGPPRPNGRMVATKPKGSD